MRNVRLSLSRGLRRLADRIHPPVVTPTWTTTASHGWTITLPNTTSTNTSWRA